MKGSASTTFVVIYLLSALWLNIKAQNGVLGSITINLDEIAVMDIEGNNSLDIQTRERNVTEAGRKPTYLANQENWLNYTISTIEGNSKAVYARVVEPVPDAFRLRVRPQNATTGNSNGILGAPVGNVRLTQNDKKLYLELNPAILETEPETDTD